MLVCKDRYEINKKNSINLKRQQHQQQSDGSSSDTSTGSESIESRGHLYFRWIYDNRVSLLLWKNFKLKIRHPWRSLFWIIVPCIFSVIMVLIRSAAEQRSIDQITIFPSHSIDDDFILMGLTEKHILYAPKSNHTDGIMKKYEENTYSSTIIGFNNESELISYYLQKNSDQICCAIIFDESISYQQNSSEIGFKLRFPFIPIYLHHDFSVTRLVELTWKTAKQWPKYSKSGPRSAKNSYGGPPDYFGNGFLFVQHEISRAIANYLDPKTEEFYDKIRLFVQRYPFPPYQQSNFLFYLQIIFPLNYVLSFLSIVLELTRDVVEEKELRLKEIMKIMGLRDWMHWLSWFLYSFVWNSLFSIIITFILCLPYRGEAILGFSDPTLIFLFTMGYVCSIITFCFLMSALPKLSDKADFAVTISAAIFFLIFLPYYFIYMNYDDLPFVCKMICAIFFNINMPFGLMMITRWENNRIGLQWSNIWERIQPDDPMTFGHILIMFVIDSSLQLLLAIYLDSVLPGKYGIGKKWLFFLDRSFWIPKINAHSNDRNSTSSKFSNVFGAGNDHSNFSKGIQIVNLYKSFDNGRTKVVKKLRLNLQSNQITVLLGHNGAGKTTLMSMLCGLIPPTSGSVYMDGHSLLRDKEIVRRNLGVCPQFDVLFHHLTVEEHLWFYCKIKQIDDRLIDKEIDAMINKLDLNSKRRQLAGTLSGGMRRKLSVGIALTGGSKFVLLDEATSGMDISARRFIWDLLINEKINRTILFSTHFMEEADVLGDKIAIMQQGKLQCFGSPYQLRKDFQIGYLLKISTDKAADKQEIVDLVEKHVEKAKVLIATSNEITFSLLDNQSSKFEQLFLTIEEDRQRLRVIDFGISVSTIEEIFLRANKCQLENIESIDFKRSKNLLDTINNDFLEKSSAIQHLRQIFLSQWSKKLIFLRRNRFLIFAHFFLPALILIMGIISGTSVVHNLIKSPSLLLNLSPYKKAFVNCFVDRDDLELQTLSNLYQQTFDHLLNVVIENVTQSDIGFEVFDYLSHKLYSNHGHVIPYHLISSLFTKIPDEDLINVTALFNNQAYHTSAISIAAIDQTFLRYSLDRNDFKLSIWNEPLPIKKSDTMNAKEFDSVFQTHIISCLLISFCFLMASFSLMLVMETSSNFKFIQQISGLKIYQYWLANFVLDYCLYTISILILAFSLYIFKLEAFFSFKRQALLILMLLLNGLFLLPFIYLLSKSFRDQYTAYVQIGLILFVSGFSTFITVLLLRIGEFNLVVISDLLDLIFTFISPIYTATMSIFSIYENYIGLNVCFSSINVMNMTIDIQNLCQSRSFERIPSQIIHCCKNHCKQNCFRFNEDYLSWESPGIGKYIIASLVLSAILWLFLIIVEGRIGKFLMGLIQISGWYNKLSLKKQIARHNTSSKRKCFRDSDVLEEEKKISNNYLEMLPNYAMIVKNVSKNYGRSAAVRNISFAVERAECFGMLGENGAGKTTTFKMITGATKMTKGDIWVDRWNTKDNMDKVFQDIGYCPQFDGLINELSGREILRIICRIRGIREKMIENQIDHLSELLQLDKFIDRIVEEYSGGTKRKLSFAIAIAGNPSITFLDEPTTGIDPVSRRALWNAIRLVRSGGSSLVLTSHSMEECEALCNRLVIMVSGKIRCIGSPLHLKYKYGNGHIIQIKLSTKNPYIRNAEIDNKDWDGSENDEISKTKQRMLNACKEIALHRFMDKNFPCRFESKMENIFTYRIVSNEISLSTMFGKIETAKQRLQIEHYSINQPSLEKIFLSFVQTKFTRKQSSTAKCETFLKIF